MPEVKLKEIDLIAQTRTIWEWLVGIKHWNSFEGWVARVLVWLIVFYVLLLVAKHLFELIAKIAEAWKTLGLKINRSPEERSHLRRRQQFSKVLIADLATLAKAESWNDQYFTDLEAEVEADGHYYASYADRLLRRQSSGLRRVPSLIEAIESSTEQCLLITGDPGSGKSVALRHLANQMAERAGGSKRIDTPIPLYINLKELPRAPYQGPTADFIKEFVLDNIRRGDADTAAYVRENWNQLREQGLWFFLFDSFDEIPVVLHAPTGSDVIRQHADAINQFFTGMGGCRGVLASREFKGPDTLPWQKFRILPLSDKRQSELINNSFLSGPHREVVLQHLTTNRNGILANPLFLTLLCRHVKDEGSAPLSDSELLWNHIIRLAGREPDYILQKYRLLPSQLVEGSIDLAVLFAEQSSLSLAPTQDQINEELAKSGKSLPYDLDRMLAALIDVKIGRCDVKEARSGDRRFTFAHRRYQETLFVQYIARNPLYLTPRTILTELRWRDYAVTLLQTCPADTVKPFLDGAEKLLREYTQHVDFQSIDASYGIDLHYYTWSDTPASSLLKLLQEGLRRRIEVVPASLREEIANYLNTRWNGGDAFDEVQVLVHGALLPENILVDRISWAIQKGTTQHWDAAMSSSFGLQKIDDKMTRWFRQQISDRLNSAKTPDSRLEVEALVARMPSYIGSKWIIKSVRQIASYKSIWTYYFKMLDFLAYRISNGRIESTSKPSVLAEIMSILLVILIAVYWTTKYNLNKIIICFIVLSLFIILTKLIKQCILISYCDLGKEMSFKSCLHLSSYRFKDLCSRIKKGVYVSKRDVSLVFLLGSVVTIVLIVFKSRSQSLVILLPISYIFSFLAIRSCEMIWYMFETVYYERACTRRLSKILNGDIGTRPVITEARTGLELTIWLRADGEHLIKSVHEARSALAFLKHARSQSESAGIAPQSCQSPAIKMWQYRYIADGLINMVNGKDFYGRERGET